MKSMRKLSALVLALSLIVFPRSGLLYAAAPAPIYPGLTKGARETLRARYEKMETKELGKLLYLVDLVSKTDVEILYDGTSFRPPVICPLARLFVLRHYNNQRAETWLRQWCAHSHNGNPISVRFPDGTTTSALDLLIGELKAF
jgi:hypothetical protein